MPAITSTYRERERKRERERQTKRERERQTDRDRHIPYTWWGAGREIKLYSTGRGFLMNSFSFKEYPF
jgi:hypothetical protein